MSSRDISQRNALPSGRLLDILTYRHRTSPVHAPATQGMTVQAITQHLTPRTFTDEPTPVEEAMLLHDALWELNRQVTAVTQVRDTMLREVQLLQQTLAAQRSAFRRIPPEVLLQIFAYVVDQPLNPFAPSTLCRVCRRWYGLVMNTRELWTRVTFELPSPRNRSGRYPHAFASARAHLTRSAPLPVSAYIAFQGQRPTAEDAIAALNVLNPYFSRCAKLYVYYETREPMYATLSTLTRFPAATALETLSLTVGYRLQERDEYVAPDRPTQPYRFFSGHAPKLKHVEMDGISIPWRPGPNPILTGLEELRLAKQPKEERPALKDFLDILRASPDLERLCISRSGPRWEEAPLEPVELPKLAVLSLLDVTPELARCFLPHICMPALEALQLSFFDHRSKQNLSASGVLDVLPQSIGRGLRSLRLENATFSPDSLVSFLLESGKELRELVLISTSASDDLFDALSPSGDPMSWISPHLASVCLERCEGVSERALTTFWRLRREVGELKRMRVVDRLGVGQTYA